VRLLQRVLGFVNAPALFQLGRRKFEDEPADVSVYQENRDVLLDAFAGRIDVVPPGSVLPVPEIPVPDEMAFLARGARRGDPRRPGGPGRAKRHVRVAYCLSPET